MIVVSDTSPINNLAAIGYLHLLEALYGTQDLRINSTGRVC